MTEPLLTPKEVAERLNVSLTQAYRLIRNRMIHVRVGRNLRVSERALEAYLTQATREPPRLARGRARTMPAGRRGTPRHAMGARDPGAPSEAEHSAERDLLRLPIETRTPSRRG